MFQRLERHVKFDRKSAEEFVGDLVLAFLSPVMYAHPVEAMKRRLGTH